MSEEPGRKGPARHRAARIFVVSLLVYVLSTGPAARLVQATGAYEPFLLIYAPLILAGKAFPPFDDAIGFYIKRVWRYTEPDAPTPVPTGEIRR